MPGELVSHISQAHPDRVEVRGLDLTGDLMGRVTFTEYFHLLLTGSEPTEEQRYFLDLLLVAIAEHGMMPTNVAARMTLAADPRSLHGAVAAGILGAGPVVLGTAEECAAVLAVGQADVIAGRAPDVVAAELARRAREAKERFPGFGHPVHRPVDPRAERILELADERGVSGAHVALARAFREAVAEIWGKPLTLNVAMPMAAVLLDLGFSSDTVKAIPILARTAGLLAHLAEERENQIGFLLAAAAEDAHLRYEFGDWVLDATAQALQDANGQPVSLTSGEFRLLEAMVTRANRVLTRDQLMDVCYGNNSPAFDRSIDVCIGRLRRKLQDDPRNPALIRTVRNGGYIFSARVARAA